ncbi:MAG: thiolase family protein [Dehalococcoidia bacterium]|nr:thiolase family protein [Dehalococcoidia bacterium]
MESVAIVSAVRTPIGAYLGALRDVPAYDLLAAVLNEAVKRAKVDPVEVDDVIAGQCYQSGEYVNIARMGALTAGWPVTVPGITLDRRCTSGLDAIAIGAMQIQTGASDIVVASAVESMSTVEFYIPGPIRWGIGRGAGIQYPDAPRGHGSLKLYGMVIYDRIQRSRPMHQPISRFGELVSNMAWAENVAKELNITRDECDRWALRSHQRAIAAIDSGKFKEYIVPIKIQTEKGEKIVDTDEGPRRDTSLEALAKLRPVLGGVCTAGNSSQENDAAAAFVLMSESMAKKRGLEPLAYLKSWAKAADDPWNPPKAGTRAFKKALEKAGLTIEQVDLFEIQEAFAAQCLYNIKTLGVPEALYDRINVNGSGISLGHPLGATLSLRTCGLVHEMKKRNARYGLVGTPGAGAIAVAGVFERR